MNNGLRVLENSLLYPTLHLEFVCMTENNDSVMYKKGFMLIPEESLGTCENCGYGTIVKFCKKYNGYIGKCTACNTNWRES
jgi:hypothetical protein